MLIESRDLSRLIHLPLQPVQAGQQIHPLIDRNADPLHLQRGVWWGWWFTLGAAISGLTWGYLGWAFFQPTLLFLLPMTLALAGQVGDCGIPDLERVVVQGRKGYPRPADRTPRIAGRPPLTTLAAA